MRKILQLFLVAFLFILVIEVQGQITLVKDINPTVGSFAVGSSPQALTRINNKVVFRADDGTFGSEPWVTDGTTNGTFLLKDIYVGTSNGVSDDFCRSGNYIYFSGYTADEGKELYRTDGTPEGTVMVTDLQSGIYNGLPPITYLEDLNGTLFFVAQDGDFSVDQLWKTDGTESGTELVLDRESNLHITRFLTATSSGQLFFVTGNSLYDSDVWVTDGTTEGTHLVKNINSTGNYPPLQLIVMNDILYFAGYDANSGQGYYSLWRSDGTEQGTYIVKPNLYLEADLTLPNQKAVVFDNKLYFSANGSSSNGFELWTSDGTEEGTYMVKDIYEGPNWSNCDYLTVAGNQLFFSATSYYEETELWVTNGTEAGTHLVKDIHYNSSLPRWLTAAGNDVYFSARDDDHGFELWTSDGTEEGTYMIEDLNTNGSSSPGRMILLNNSLLFSAADVAHGQELWKLDNVLGIEDSYVKDKVTVYPNPAGSELNIKLPSNGQFSCQVVNELGQVMITSEHATMETKVDVSTLAKGMYILVVNMAEGKTYQHKFVKQ